jgi:subtilisin family serine protease
LLFAQGADMRRLIIVSLFLVYAASMLFAHALPGEKRDKPSFAPDKIKIQLTEEAYSQTNIPEEMYAEAEVFGIAELDAFLAEFKASKIIRAHRKVKDTAWEQQTGFNRWFIVLVPTDTDILKAVKAIRKSRFIDNSIPEYIAYPDLVPNDTFYDDNWGHNNTAQLLSWAGGAYGSHAGAPVGTIGFDSNAQVAWNNTQAYGSASVIIAIIDTGVDINHPDLRLVAGYDYGEDDNNPMDDSGHAGHGTCCAGIAAARANNNLGVAGIGGGCSIMPLKAANEFGTMYFTAINNCLTHAGDNGADIISMSLGNYYDPGSNPDTDLAILYAYNNGIVLFASSGNDNTNSANHYPSCNSKVISVGATAPCGERKSPYSSDGEYWWGSNYPSDIMAPTILPTTDVLGVNGISTGDYEMWFNGTSCSSPYAAGVAGLLLSKYPNLSPVEVKFILTSTATDMTVDGGIGWDTYTGNGMVNASAALSYVTNHWTGEYSSNWAYSGNWTGGVPLVSDNVTIFPVEAGHFYPNVSTAIAYCNNLYIAEGASVTVSTHNLVVNENLTVYGNLLITGNIDVVVNGNVRWGEGSTANMTNAGSEMYVLGHMYFNPGSNIQLVTGTIEFFGDNSSGIYVNETAHIYNLRNNKNVGSFLGTSQTSDHDLYIHGNFANMTDRVFKHQYPGTIHLKGNFINNILGAYWFNDGTISFEGSSNQTYYNYSTLISYFNNIIINLSNNAVMDINDDIEVRGNVDIISGIFQCNNNDIELRGNWTNNVGEAAFIEGDGAIILTGTTNQYLFNEHFGNLDLNKTSGEMRIPAGSIVTCDKYNLTTGVYRVTGGTFTVANRLIQPGIHGTIYLDSGTINYHQGPEDRNDFNGTLYINGGSFNMYGGSDDCYWAYAANAALHMTGGVFDFKEKSIIITNLVTILTLDIIDGTIRTARAYQCNIDYVNLPGGTLELYGTEDALLHISPLSSVFNLNINKSSSRSLQSGLRRSRERNERDNAVAADGDMLITGNLTISQGRFDVRQFNLQVNGSITVYGVLKKNSAGSIITYGDFIWQPGSASDITAGTIQCNRHWRFYNGSTVNLSSVTTNLIASQPAEITASSPTAWFGTLNLGLTIVDISTFTLVEESTDALIVKGPLTITGAYTLHSEGIPIKTENGVTVNSSCKLSLGPDAVLRLKIGTSLTINSGGTLEVIGSAGHPATITHLTTGYYYCNIESGATISAEYGIFEYMQPQGVNVKYGSLVDAVHSFHYCTFRNGYSNQTLLTIANNQTFSVYGANFPSSTISSLYNVNKNLNLGVVTFINATGAFSGEAYDNDPYNRVNWTTTQCNLVINDATPDIAELYVCESLTYGVTVYNNSANATVIPVRVDVYFNPPSPPPSGQAGDLHFYISPLAAYGAATYIFPEITSETAGVWYSAFRVDALNEISETNENDNSYSDNIIEWLGLPDIENMTIDYNESTGTVELNWTYPEFIPYDYFRIYSSDNPMDQFNTLVGTTTNTFYTAPTPYIKRFYRVTASKEWQ